MVRVDVLGDSKIDVVIALTGEDSQKWPSAVKNKARINLDEKMLSADTIPHMVSSLLEKGNLVGISPALELCNWGGWVPLLTNEGSLFLCGVERLCTYQKVLSVH